MKDSVGGRYRSKMNLVMPPSKSGKSVLASSLALYDLLTGPNGAEVYLCAVDKDEARILFATAKAMLERSPTLRPSDQHEVVDGD